MKSYEQCAAEIDGLMERDLAAYKDADPRDRLASQVGYLRSVLIAKMIELEIANAELGVKPK